MVMQQEEQDDLGAGDSLDHSAENQEPEDTENNKQAPSETTSVDAKKQSSVLLSRASSSISNNNVRLQMQAVRQIFSTSLRSLCPCTLPRLHEIAQAAQTRIEDYIPNMQDASWQPWPYTPAYSPDEVYQVLEELHSVAVHAAMCSGKGELGFEAFVDAVQWGMKTLKSGGEWGGCEEFWDEGVTEMHLAVSDFVEQVLCANRKGK
ncbi:Nn.00g106400.m01.CDS01 [Neocucurbitaria sp. VM-36]